VFPRPAPAIIDSEKLDGSEDFPFMQTEALQTPVALFVFKRPDTTRRVFEAVSKVRPTKLLLVADGPRQGKEGEAEACRQVREIVSRADWPCEIFQNFSDRNLGCQGRMVTGLNWVFSLVEESIILEDDCVPDPSFFLFCQELLERYRGDTRIGSISGSNFMEKHLNTDASYFFSQFGGNWGWASWRSEWQRFDRHLTDWPKLKTERMLLKNNALAIVPRVNLVANIGFGLDATHTTQVDDRLVPPVKAMEFPLRHPSSFVPLRSVDRKLQQLYFAPYSLRVLRRLHRIAKTLIG
jgi:hypothetical protein